MGRHVTRRLSARRIEAINKPGRYSDGDNLALQVGPGGGKSWLFCYMRERRGRQMGLGPLELVSLKEAREKAWDCRRLLLEGIDPIEHRNAQRARALKSKTFKECAVACMAAHEAAWKHPRSAQQWQFSMETYVYPVMADLPVSSIETAHVLKCIEPIWKSKAVTASRVRGRIEDVLDWAKARGYRDGENPARWRGHLDKLLPAQRRSKTVRHHPALPWAEAPAFVAELRAVDSVDARALEFLIMSAARTAEVLGATWDEIDLEAGVWSLPAERMKSRRPHRVPLASHAVELLRGLPREVGSQHIFVGGRRGQALNADAMPRVLKSLRPDITVHGFRSTFRDWAAETTAVPGDVVEMALAHAVSNQTEAAYRRGDLFEKRRKLMEAWAEYLAQPVRSAASVVPMKSA